MSCGIGLEVAGHRIDPGERVGQRDVVGLAEMDSRTADRHSERPLPPADNVQPGDCYFDKFATRAPGHV